MRLAKCKAQVTFKPPKSLSAFIGDGRVNHRPRKVAAEVVEEPEEDWLAVDDDNWAPAFLVRVGAAIETARWARETGKDRATEEFRLLARLGAEEWSKLSNQLEAKAVQEES